MVTRGNPFEIAPNHAKLRKMYGSMCGNALSYGNTLHYGLSMLKRRKKMYGNACGDALKLW